MKKILVIIVLMFVFTSCREETSSMVQFRGKTVDKITENVYSFEIFFTDGSTLKLWSNNSVFKTIKNKK